MQAIVTIQGQQNNIKGEYYFGGTYVRLSL